MSAFRVLYSIGVRFAGGGIGNVAHHGVSGLYRHGMLRRLLCGSYRSTEIPDACIRSLGPLSRLLRKLAVYDPGRFRITSFHNVLYDRWVRRNLEPCDIFLSWNGFGLQALRKAKAGGARTAVYRASSHPLEQARLLREEHLRWGQRHESRGAAVDRATTEIQEADYVVIPSDFVYQSCLKQGLEPHKLIQIPFGVDVTRFHPPGAPPAEIPFRVLFVGQLGLRKGAQYLLQAWEKLRWSDAELWLVGRVQTDFEALLRSYRHLPGLRLQTHIADLAPFLRRGHLFIFPTIEEGSALAVYEAMASGLPVITTPNAGSLVRDDQDGYIVPIRDVETLAERMEALRTDAQRRSEMGKAARRRVEPYTWRRYADALAAKLDEVAGARA